jgi:putative DNA-invertase from lambdoid prophage Rac
VIHKQKFFAPADYTAQIYGYGRVSHKLQMDQGNSVPAQEERIAAYIKMRQLEPDSPFQKAMYAGMFAEPKAQSAFSKPFKRRITGEELMELMRPGDHLVVDKLDRFTRSAEDFFSMDRYFCEHGIRLHIINLGGASLDSGTACGRVMLGVLVLSAEFESMLKGERVRDARARLRAQKMHAGTGVPFFCQVIGSRGGKAIGGGGKLVFRDWALPLMERIKYLLEEAQLGSWKMATAIYEERKNHPEWPKLRTGHRHGVDKLMRLYWFYEAWNAASRPDINELKFKEFVDRYKQSRKKD